MTTKKKHSPKCLVLHSKKHDDYYGTIYSPAIKKAKLEPISVNKILTTGPRIKKISETINHVAFIIADVSDRDRDVLFRAGLAEAMDTPVGIIAQRADDIPSDLQHVGYAIYDTRQPGWEKNLKKDIAELIAEGLDENR